MSIKHYQNMLEEIKNKILNKELRHKNSIIVGDNSSGKSEILKQILIKQESGYYFIDSVNRSFDYTKVSSLKNIEKESYKNVLNFRLSDKMFNLKDSFDLYKTGGGAIEQVYFNFDMKLKKIIKDFIDIDFDIKIEENDILGKIANLYIDKNIEKISSGYQAIIRIFLETIYFEDMVDILLDSPVLVIDEINEFLSPKNEEKILPFLMKQFNKMNFIVTTHSADVIASSINCNIIALKENTYECLDGDDFTSVTDVREIFEKIYNINIDKDTPNKDIEMVLRSLLNAKISNQWTKIEDEKMKEIDENKLSNVQKLLFKQVQSW